MGHRAHRCREGVSAPRRSASVFAFIRIHRRFAWISIGFGVLCGVLAGCAKKPQTADQVLRISQRNEPSDLDPATASLPDEFFIIRALGEGLLVPNPVGGEPLPAAAERYEVSPDGLTYTFHLRRNAQWSNGEPVTARDFVAAFERVLTPDTAAPKAHLFHGVRNAAEYARRTLRDFDQVGIHAPDTHILVVDLVAPNRNFPLCVASGPWIPTNPRSVAKHARRWTDPANHVGNGPFTLAEWRPQQRIVVKRNPRYHGAGDVGLQEIHFVRVDSPDTEDRAYRAGQIDVTMAVPQSKLDSYARERPAELQRTALAETRFLSFNTQRPPLSDPRVRRALALAIDRDRIVTFVLKGGQLPATRFLSPALLDGTRITGKPGAQHGFDPGEARRLLAAAGFPEGRGFPSLELAGWVQNPVLETIQQMWRQELGVDIRIRIQEAKVHLAAVKSGNYDLAFVTNLLDLRDAAAALSDFTSDAPNNFPHWHSIEFDRLIRTAHVDGGAIVDAESLILKDAPITPIYFNVQNWLKAPRVRSWQQDALWARRYNEVRVVPDPM